VSTVTFWATVILATSWLTRWGMGALEPTQGQETEAAAAGWAALATLASVAAPREAAAIRDVQRNTGMVPPEMSSCRRRDNGFPHNIDLAETAGHNLALK
jgi:hypothetical protein